MLGLVICGEQRKSCTTSTVADERHSLGQGQAKQFNLLLDVNLSFSECLAIYLLFTPIEIKVAQAQMAEPGCSIAKP